MHTIVDFGVIVGMYGSLVADSFCLTLNVGFFCRGFDLLFVVWLGVGFG